MKNLKTNRLTRLGLLVAITVILAATPLGYIPAGALSFTIMVLPVVVAGVTMGLQGGIITGLAFGITSLIKAPSEALGQLIISYSGLFTVMVCVLPRFLVGAFSGLCGAYLAKKERVSVWAYALCGTVASVINTVFFLGLIYIFCSSLVEGAFGAAIWASVSIGGVVEAIANGVLSMLILKGLTSARIK